MTFGRVPARLDAHVQRGYPFRASIVMRDGSDFPATAEMRFDSGTVWPAVVSGDSASWDVPAATVDAIGRQERFELVYGDDVVWASGATVENATGGFGGQSSVLVVPQGEGGQVITSPAIKGDEGRGVASIADPTTSGTAVVTYTDGTVDEFPLPAGPQGAPGGTDAATAGWVESGPLTTAALEASPPILDKLSRERAPLMMLDYCVGDGVTNDTAGAQAAIDAAIVAKRSLYSPPGAEYLVDPLTVTGTLTLEGEYLFSARSTNQATVLTLTGRQDWARATVHVNGKNRALYGVRGSSLGRSKFGHLDVNRCQIWGLQYDKSGNNNLVTYGVLTATLNGQNPAVTLTETAETANVLTSTAGYGTFTLSTPIDSRFIGTDMSYFLRVGTLGYKIRSLTTTTVEVFNLKAAAGVGDTLSAVIMVGGGFNCPAWGDNGVGSFGALDIASNKGIGVHQSSLYGHVYNNAVFQANGIGFACEDYTQQTTIPHPYFENNNGINIISWQYIEGLVTAPVMNMNTVQNCVNRIAGNGHFDPRLIILKNQTYGLTTNLVPASNPGSRTLVPGMSYGFHFTGSLSETFVIDNKPEYAAFGAHFIMVDLSHANSGTVGSLTVSLGQANGETVEGGATYTARVSGKTTMKIVRVGTDWKVLLLRSDVHTSIAAAPIRVGQLAVAGGLGYMAVGTASAADWKQITN